MADWPWRTVAEVAAPNGIAIGPFGSRMKADRYVPEGVPVIRGMNISDTRALGGEFVYVSEQTANELRTSNAISGDLVFPHRGAIGRVALVPADGRRWMLSTAMMKFTPDTRVVDPLFLFYYFRSKPGRAALLANTSTVGTPGIGQPLTTLRAIRLPVPPLDEQRRIAGILGALDDKIELDRLSSETLEGTARALFKLWFFDSEPDASDQDGSLADAVELLRNLVDPQREPDTVFEHFSLPAYDAGREAISELGAGIKSSKLAVPRGSVLLSKLNPEIERVWLPDIGPDDRAICSTEFLVMRPRVGVGRSFVYEFLKSASFRSTLTSLVTGTTGSHQRAHAEAILQVPLRLPGPSRTAKFERLVGPMLDRVDVARRESRSVVALRDAILPRLLSGEIGPSIGRARGA